LNFDLSEWIQPVGSTQAGNSAKLASSYREENHKLMVIPVLISCPQVFAALPCQGRESVLVFGLAWRGFSFILGMLIRTSLKS